MVENDALHDVCFGRLDLEGRCRRRPRPRRRHRRRLVGTEAVGEYAPSPFRLRLSGERPHAHGIASAPARGDGDVLRSIDLKADRTRHNTRSRGGFPETFAIARTVRDE